jgi:RNA polymerase sigma-70 factor (ECF subfamily)
MVDLSPQQLELHRSSLLGHCYRMLGSIVEAEDAVQETLFRAWRGLETFDSRASLRTWLHRIATNACLDALGERKRRVRVFDDGPQGSVDGELEKRDRTHWLEPVPDERVIPPDSDPATQVILRESVRLAFVAALQFLPPKQRAVLLLTDVLGFSAADVALTLDTSVASVNSALQRARGTLAERSVTDSLPDKGVEQQLVDRYVRAFEAYDVDSITALLREDTVMSMPPYTLWLCGPSAIRHWLLGKGIGCRGSRLLPTRASGAPAFGQYRVAPEGGYRAWSLNVLELSGNRIARMTYFLDVESLFPKFGLPFSLAEGH